MEPLDLNNVIEVKQILKKCNENETNVLNYILNVANIHINKKEIQISKAPFILEPINLSPKLSDHSSDESDT